MKAKSRLPREEKPGELNMTPMIDVVFQLLIFFMLSMRFRAIEGKLITTLPQDKGLQSSTVLSPELEEVRIILCAAGPNPINIGSNDRYYGESAHRSNKGEHERIEKDPTLCKALVEKNACGELIMTEKNEKSAAANRAVYKNVAAKAKQLDDMRPSTRDPSKAAPIIIDADSEVPYEHVLGVINALREVDISNVEFAGNPRFDLYYGSGQRGQFQRR
ncbi:MAG: biopolymer transporter ExbD [Planctomycetes bacterium]|nr:biopolymer transporter ExbD [Planctomycetota bacterium]